MDFFGVESPLLSWIGDETFFGLCSRQHELWGHGNSATTALVLFGQKRLGTHHDLPSGLGAFSRSYLPRRSSLQSLICKAVRLRI
jgi:hypothetical protein